MEITKFYHGQCSVADIIWSMYFVKQVCAVNSTKAQIALDVPVDQFNGLVNLLATQKYVDDVKQYADEEMGSFHFDLNNLLYCQNSAKLLMAGYPFAFLYFYNSQYKVPINWKSDKWIDIKKQKSTS